MLAACARGEPASDPPAAGVPGAATPTSAVSEDPTVRLLVAGTLVTAEVADDPQERARGLMERRSLEPDHGMVFVYPEAAPRSFWMKNTPLPLSIAFMDAGGTVVRVADMQPGDETPVPSLRPAMYALEMEQGWFAAHEVHEGAVIEGLPGPSAR